LKSRTQAMGCSPTRMRWTWRRSEKVTARDAPTAPRAYPPTPSYPCTSISWLVCLLLIVQRVFTLPSVCFVCIGLIPLLAGSLTSIEN
jgi:hypothetical protein